MGVFSENFGHYGSMFDDILDIQWECVWCDFFYFWALYESLRRLLDTLWECVYRDFLTTYKSAFSVNFGLLDTQWECVQRDFWTNQRLLAIVDEPLHLRQQGVQQNLSLLILSLQASQDQAKERLVTQKGFTTGKKMKTFMSQKVSTLNKKNICV